MGCEGEGPRSSMSQGGSEYTIQYGIAVVLPECEQPSK